MTERLKITVEKNELPSNLFTLGILEPLFYDRRLASKRMPFVNSGEKVGYTVEELLIAMCIEDVNNMPVDKNARAKDPVYMIKALPTDDLMALLAIFSGSFFINKNDAELIKEESKRMRNNASATEHYLIKKDLLPNQYGDITFCKPTTNVQIEVNRSFPDTDANPGYTQADLFFAHCIQTINGKPVDKPKEIITMFDDWTFLDYQYASAIFSNITYIDQDDFNKANDLGKNKREELRNLRSTAKVTKKEVSTTTSK